MDDAREEAGITGNYKINPLYYSLLGGGSTNHVDKEEGAYMGTWGPGGGGGCHPTSSFIQPTSNFEQLINGIVFVVEVRY